MLICLENNSKTHPLKKGELEPIEIDLNTVDFTRLDGYDLQIEHEKKEGGGTLNLGSKRREEWESDQRLLDYIGLLAYAYPKKEVAARMGIAYKTLLVWERESELIRTALSTTKESFCRELEGTLKHRARGYDYEEVKTIVLGDVQKGSNVVENQQTVKIEKTKKHREGDVGAAIFLLTNLAPEKWKNRRNTDTRITDTVPVVITGGDDIEE